MEYRAAIVRKDLGEIVPRRAFDLAIMTGAWYKHIIPVWPSRRTRKGGRADTWFRAEADAIRAMGRIGRTHKLDLGSFRGLVWARGRDNEPALTVAI